MSDITLECKGLPCPQPVLKCKKAIENDAPATISIIVDNDAAKENVSRFLKTMGYEASWEQDGSVYTVTGIKKDDTGDCEVCQEMSETEISDLGQNKILIFLAADVMGSGDDELGSKLMMNFLLTLKEMGSDLWRIVMVNGGVKLSVPDSPCMAALKDLEQGGVSILVCGTCLEHFSLSGANGVGEVTNMLDIVTSFQLATKVIRV